MWAISLSVIIIGVLVDAQTLSFKLKRIRGERVMSGLPVVGFVLYLTGVLIIPAILLVSTSAVYKLVSMSLLMAYHVSCQWLIPVLYDRWLFMRRR